MIKSLFKRLMFAVAPRTAIAVMSARTRAFNQRYVKSVGLIDLTEKIAVVHGRKVLSGPFKGMTLSPMVFQEFAAPFLLGTYEAELLPWIEQLKVGRYSHIIDIGAKFGYYSVGLARIFPDAVSIAYDTDRWARRAVAQLAAANGISGIQIKGFCSQNELARYDAYNPLIVSDCEGFEQELFCSVDSPKCRNATMLIETHEMLSPGVSQALCNRFAKSHSVESVQYNNKREGPPDVDLSFLSADEKYTAIHDYRPVQDWLLFRPLNGT